jgi:acetyl esterase
MGMKRMNIDKLILTVMKHLPNPLVRAMAGPAQVIDGYSLDPNIQIVGKKAPIASSTTIEALRETSRVSFKILNAPRRQGVDVVDREIDGPAGKMAIREYTPAGAAGVLPGILFFHQGGFVVMDLDTCDTFCTILADICQAKVISLDYRLCPENDFPAPIEDALALWKYVQDNATALAIDPARVAVAGDSAGGLISVNVCLKLRASRQKHKPVAQLLAYPWVSTDLTQTGSLVSCAECFPLNSGTMEFFNAAVFPDGREIDSAEANPLKAKSLKNMPPAVIGTAGFDPIRDQGNAYADRLKAEGNIVDHYCFGSLSHSYLALGGVTKAAEEASEQLARDLKKYL